MIQRGLTMKMMATPVALGQAPDHMIEFLVHLSQSLEELMDQGLTGLAAVLGSGCCSFHQQPQAVEL